VNKKLLGGLLLLALAVVVIILNPGHVKLALAFRDLDALKPLVYLGFLAAGVVIGILLK